jgi:beta-glucosidase
LSSEHIRYQDGFAFKDLNRNGVLDPYEDWRLPLEERLDNLVKRLTVEEIAGLMLHSGHQTVCKGDPMAELLYHSFTALASIICPSSI